MANERWAATVRNLVVGMVAGAAICLFVGGRSTSLARAQTGPVADPSATIAFTSGGNGPGQCFYIVDTKEKAFAIYQVDSAKNPAGAVKLLAARQYRWDLKLAEFNNQPPDVASINSMIESSSRKEK